MYLILLPDGFHEVVACHGCVNTLNERTQIAGEIMCKESVESVAVAVLHSILKESRRQNPPEAIAEEVIANQLAVALLPA